jgi:hypothetical protein
MSNVVKEWLSEEGAGKALPRRCVVLDLGVVRDAAFERFLGEFVAKGQLE